MDDLNSRDFSVLSTPDRTENLDFLTFALPPHLKTATPGWLIPQTPLAGAALGIFLVSVPVLFEAPLVRALPWVSLGATLGWLGLSWQLAKHPQTIFWSELTFGLSLSWLAGAIYWGWFRWEPALHLPIEAIALPLALWGWQRGWCKVGNCFYLGSLLGTAVTDLYFYRMHLMPYWRELMVSPPEQGLHIIRVAFGQIQTVTGISTALALTTGLLAIAAMAWQSSQRHSWVFAGTLMGTLLVDGLFVLLAKA